MRILVIDDEPLVVDVIAEALRLEDHDVVVASSGEEGLRVIAQNPPEAVFLDIIMPEMDERASGKPGLAIIVKGLWRGQGGRKREDRV